MSDASGLPVVQLSDEELMLYATAGAQRAVKCMLRKAAPAEGAGHWDDWQISIEGVLGEAAVAKHYNLYVSSVQGYGAIDVGGIYEVRTSKNHGDPMRIKQSDPDHLPFFLVNGINGRYVIRGWIYAGEAKREEWFSVYKRPGHPVYWVPVAKLNPPNKLPKEIKAKQKATKQQRIDESLGF
jgi:hypothetical protein